MDDQQLEERLTVLDRLQSACTHCGLCSEGCATFQSTGWEQESPRGRLQLAAQFLHGKMHPQSQALSTFDRCLGCQACQSLCPHQVEYQQVRQIVQELRRELDGVPFSKMDRQSYRRWISIAKQMGYSWWRNYRSKWKKEEKLVLAVCCVQELYQHEVIDQALAFAKRLGFSFVVDRHQPCCGALFERLVHGGEEAICYPREQKKATKLQQRTREAFLSWMGSTTYFLARGCQNYMSKSAETQDFYQWIARVLEEQNLQLYFSASQVVYYQPYCGSGQREHDSIWRLLKSIEGLIIREIANPLACCGGYCGEAYLHPENAQAWVSQKVAELPKGATLVVTSPDCWSIFKIAGERKRLNLCYPIHLLMNTSIKR